ncbi:MAG: cytochrome c peroxidase [Planctomycetota bacterium]
MISSRAGRCCQWNWLLNFSALAAANAILIVLCASVPVTAQIRRQVATTSAGDWILLANRDSNSVSFVDKTSRELHGEFEVGKGPSDVVALTTELAVVACEKESALVVMAKADNGWVTRDRVVTQGSPTRLYFDSASSLLYASCRWDRSVEVFSVPIDLTGGLGSSKGFTSQSLIELPFEPGRIIVDGDSSTVLVAGAFRAEMAVISTADFKLRGVHLLPGHNIAGLAIEGEMLWLSQQQLDPLAHSTRDDVHWGNMLANRLVAYRIQDLVSTFKDPSPDEAASLAERQQYPAPSLKPARRIELGEPGDAAGDPGEIQLVDGKVFILLRGVRELGILDLSARNELKRVELPGYPVDMEFFSKDVAIADGFSDSIIWLDRETQQVEGRSLETETERSQVQEGEMLFRDARLSLEGWMSCHSCHPQGHTNHQLNDNRSDGGFGSAKRVLSLLGVAGTEPLAWTGQVDDLETQVERSVLQTMQGKGITEGEIESIAAFIRELPSPKSLSKFSAEDPATEHAELGKQIAMGKRVFRKLDCNRCHAEPNFTSSASYAVGLSDRQGNDQFNPPSLNGVVRRPRLLHDASAKGLIDLLVDKQHPSAEGSGQFDPTELEALIAYLKSL